MATKVIHLLFVNPEGVMLDSDHQDRMFQSVYQTVLEACTIQVNAFGFMIVCPLLTIFTFIGVHNMFSFA